MLNLFKVYVAEDVADYIIPVLHSGYIGEGTKSKEFEDKFAAFIKHPNVVLVNSGTSAITMALKLAGVGHGDTVVSVPSTCLATNMAILSVGANIVWADILRDGTINPIDAEQKAIKNKAKAIVCMDWGGKPCLLDELQMTFQKHCIPIIEDACQSIGSEYKCMPVGHNAQYVCFSFQAIKHLTMGDGGALAINTGQIETAKMMRWFGLDRTSGADMRCLQEPPVAGYKWQSNDILASIGLANLNGLQERIDKTKEHAARYDKAFGVVLNRDDTGRNSGYWLYTIFDNDVDGFIEYMKKAGVECSRVHDRNDTKTIFSGLKGWWEKEDLPGVDWFDKHHVCIPVGWWLSDEDVDYIIKMVRGWA